MTPRTIATAVLLALALSACRRVDTEVTTGDRTARAAGVELEDGASLYALDALDQTFVDENGRARALRDLGGRTVVAAMVYTSCTSICPRVTAAMKALDDGLDARTRARVRFVLFSVDPGRDTPEVRRQFMADHRLDASRWTFLATSDDGVRNLAAVLGATYARSDDGQIVHSAMIVVIDRTGVVRYRQNGFDGNLRSAVASVVTG